MRARNDIRLSEIKQAIEENDDTFAIEAFMGIPTIARLLKTHQASMKHMYLVPYERNNDRVKQLQAECSGISLFTVLLLLFDADATSKHPIGTIL